MKHAIVPTALALLALAPACAGPLFVSESEQPARSGSPDAFDPWATSGDAAGSPAGAAAWRDGSRDGSRDRRQEPVAGGPAAGPGVAPAQTPGSILERDVLDHDVEPTANGRMYLLELYQQAIDERDALEVEVDSLTRVVERERELRENEHGAREAAEQTAAGLEAEVEALTAENRELLSRLTTAQIRRLEAERLLLEAKIEWLEKSAAAQRLGTSLENIPMSAATGASGTGGSMGAPNRAGSDGGGRP